ncbi:MAG: class I SAM-dependent methyltransferase [Promethearchaeota archaeon]
MKKWEEMLDKKERIMKKYNLTSNFYDKRYSIIQQEKYDFILKDYVLNDKFVLDAGCGTGLLFDFIQKSVNYKEAINYFYVAMDISNSMLKNFELKIRDKEKKIKNKINLILADLENLPIRDNIFNSFISITSLQNIPNIFKGFEEFFRVLRDKADLKLSILKKKINLEKIEMMLKPMIEGLEIIKINDIEDIFIKGKLLKN